MDSLLAQYAKLDKTNGFDEHGDPLVALVVEDSPVQQAELRYALWTVGYLIKDAYSIEEALEHYKSSKPHVVTLDLLLPDADGVEGLKRILELDPDAKIVIISPQAIKEIVLQAVKLGVHNFIAKPFDEKNLKQGLEVIKTAALSKPKSKS
ncbi:response regulator [bacterium]|nr:response regulator [bacterium]